MQKKPSFRHIEIRALNSMKTKSRQNRHKKLMLILKMVEDPIHSNCLYSGMSTLLLSLRGMTSS